MFLAKGKSFCLVGIHQLKPRVVESVTGIERKVGIWYSNLHMQYVRGGKLDDKRV
jgi:hypothetical protein